MIAISEQKLPKCPKCKTEMVDATNGVVVSGFMCLGCGYMKPSNEE